MLFNVENEEESFLKTRIAQGLMEDVLAKAYSKKGYPEFAFQMDRSFSVS